MMPQNEHGVDDEDLLSYDRRFLLIGKTGSGKSVTGNIIFNDQVFKSGMSTSSVTRVSQSYAGSVNNRRVTVTDTPDFNFSTHTDFDSDSELKRALELCFPGVHVILLLLPLNTFTQHELDFICWFEQALGVEALRFTLVLFTHADKRHNRPLRDIIRGNNELSDFINRCGRRYHEFNINAPANRRQVTELMEKIDSLVSENRNSCYTLEMMQEIERRREEEERRQVENKRRQKKEKEERGERELQMEKERVRKETEACVKKEYEKKFKEERDKILNKNDKKRVEFSLLKQIKLKYVCVITVCALAAGGISMWNNDSSPGWTFMRGCFTGGSAAATGALIRVFWRLLEKSPLLRDCFISYECPSAVRQFLLKTGGVFCGSFAGAVMHHFIGGNLLYVAVLAGAAGFFTARDRSS